MAFAIWGPTPPLMANETPSRPPPLMANAIKNFHFDFLTTSLIGQILWQLESGVRGQSFPKQLLGTQGK